MTIGERLKEERQRLGMSQTELAEQCGVSKTPNWHMRKANAALTRPIY